MVDERYYTVNTNSLNYIGRVPRKDHLRIGHVECSECGTPIGCNNRSCHNCGARLLEDGS